MQCCNTSRNIHPRKTEWTVLQRIQLFGEVGVGVEVRRGPVEHRPRLLLHVVHVHLLTLRHRRRHFARLGGRSEPELLPSQSGGATYVVVQFGWFSMQGIALVVFKREPNSAADLIC